MTDTNLVRAYTVCWEWYDEASKRKQVDFAPVRAYDALDAARQVEIVCKGANQFRVTRVEPDESASRV